MREKCYCRVYGAQHLIPQSARAVEVHESAQLTRARGDEVRPVCIAEGSGLSAVSASPRRTTKLRSEDGSKSYNHDIYFRRQQFSMFSLSKSIGYLSSSHEHNILVFLEPV